MSQRADACMLEKNLGLTAAERGMGLGWVAVGLEET